MASKKARWSWSLVEGEPLKGPLPIEKAVEYAGQKVVKLRQ
jgi:hypothetical protein